MNVLLIHQGVRDAHVFVQSVNPNTRAIVYHDQTDLLAELTGPIQQMGIVFIKGMTFMGKPFDEQVDLLNAAIAQCQIQRIDFLACQTLPDWADFYAKLNTVVGASSDLTGNLKYGGNWIMESTGQDIESVYFTDSIEYYKYLLDFGGSELTYVIKEDTKLYMKGFNRENQQGIDNKLLIRGFTPVNITLDASAKIVAHESSSYILTNNKIYVAGDEGPNDMRALSTHPDVISNVDPAFKQIFNRNTTGRFIEIPTGVVGFTAIQDIAVNRYGCMILIDFVPYFISHLPGVRATNDRFTKIDILDSSGTIITATKLWGSNSRYFALTSDGLYGVGHGSYGALGPHADTLTWKKIPLPSSPSGIITEISSSEDGVLMIMDGILYMLGYNGTRRFGEPAQVEVNVFTKVKYNNVDTSGVTHVSMYNSAVMYVMNGKIYKNNVEVTLPSSAIGGTIEKISTGIDHFLMVISGRLYGMGATTFCQLGATNRVMRSGLSSPDIVTPTELLMNGSSISPTSILATPFSGSFIVVNGILYAMGRNPYGALGIPLIMRTDTLTPVQYNGQDITGVTKAYSLNTKTILAAGGEIYVAGSAADGALGIPHFFIAWQKPEVFITEAFMKPVLPAGSSGPIQYVRVGTGNSVYFVRGGKVYGTGNETLVGSTTFIELPLPAGVTGTIDGFEAGSGFIVMIIGGKLYGKGINNNHCLGRNDTSRVTTISSCDRIVGNSSDFITQNVIMVSCTQWYDARDYTIFVQKDPATNLYTLYGLGDTYGLFNRISFPSGVPITSTIDYIASGQNYSMVIFGGRLYRLKNGGWTGPLQLGGAVITNAKEVSCGRGQDVPISSDKVLIGSNLYARGQNLYQEIAPTGVDLDWTFITDGLAGGSVTIESVSRMTGTTDTQITITGTLLNTVTSIVLDPDTTATVSAGAVSCEILAGRTATSITFKLPAGNGTKKIKLVTADKTYLVTGSFAYRNPIVVNSLSSYTGTKGKIVTIRASDMSDLKYVKFNGVSTTAFSRISATEYTVIVPESTSGAVILEDVYTVESIPPMGFGYQNAALVNGFVSPATSNSAATITGSVGDRLVLTGSNLSNTKTVYFGNTVATLVSAVSDNIVVTVPVEIGTVNIQAYDDNNNMTVCAKPFVYQLEAVVQGAVQAIVQASTIDASGQKYYSILEGTNYFVVKYISDTSYNKLYSNALQPIRGIACSGTTLYLCDPSNNRIQSIPTTTTTMLTVATPVLTRVTMVPEAIKAKDAKLWIVCTNTGVSTNDAIVILDGSVTAQTYASFAGYSLQGIAYNPNVSDTTLYVSTVNYVQPNKVLTAGTGQVFKTNATGGNVLPFIQGLTNPIDLTFSNGYLVVDGIINIYSPSGALVSTLNTPANSIITEVRLGQQVVSFTTADGDGTTVNELAMPPYIESQFQLTSAYSPNKGPKGTMVTIVGYNMSAEGITSIRIRDSSNNLIEPLTTSITTNVIVLRMPDKPASGTEVSIVVTPVTGSPQVYAFSYQSPDLVNIIPLYKGETKYYHFTGHNLLNIQYVEFVNNTTDVLSANKIPVRDVTDTSFDCTIEEIQLNTTRCLLLDAFGAVTIEDANYFSLSSETCFIGGTPVMTDQGEVPIDKLDSSYTIDQREILAITKTRYNKDSLILLEKDCLKKNYPTRDTVITHKHKIYYKGKMKRAESFIGKRDGVKVIPYKNQYLYNVLLRTHEVMRVNGLVCETLYPKNPIAKFFSSEV